MSRENVEVVRRAFEFFGRGELPFDVADPEIRIDNIPDWPIPGPYYGHEGLRRWWDDLTDVVPDLRLHLEDVVDVGDERIVAIVRAAAGPSSRVGQLMEHTPSWAVVHWVSNGLIVRTAGYVRKDEALDAVGLRE
jgi:ketosteroid isomerase-like protein